MLRPYRCNTKCRTLWTGTRDTSIPCPLFFSEYIHPSLPPPHIKKLDKAVAHSSLIVPKHVHPSLHSPHIIQIDCTCSTFILIVLLWTTTILHYVSLHNIDNTKCLADTLSRGSDFFPKIDDYGDRIFTHLSRLCT